MGESQSVIARLSAKDNGFSSTLKSAIGSVKSLASEIKSGFAFGVLSGMGQQAFSAITSGVSGLISEMNASNASWKTFRKNLQIVDKDSGYIKKAENELKSYAQKTVYSSSDMATTFAQLEAVGTKNTTQLVKGFGGLAAAAENPQQAMKTLSQQATQMAAKPNVAWADFKLMLEQTPAGIAAVAKEMGMSTAEMVTAVQDGKVSTDKFFEAITKAGNSKAFEKMATEAKTVGAAMDGLKETVGNKLMPVFDFFSQKAIGAINKVSDKLGSINAEALVAKISSTVDKIGLYWDALKESFSGVGTEVWGAIKEIGAALGSGFGSADSVSGFKDAMSSVADVIKQLAGFVKENASTIATLIKWLPAIAIGIKGFKLAKAVAPGVMSFAKGIASLAGKGIGGIASKLFGISKSQKEVGTTSATTGAQMLTAAKSYALMGVAVLAIALGFAVLAQTAIALAGAGWGAIAVFIGLTAALVGLGIGMMIMLKSLSTVGASATTAGASLLMVGAAVLLVAVGFALLANSAIALAAAGTPAIAIMAGMVVVIALLAVIVATLGSAMLAGAVGFLIFGAAILLCGVGAVLAAASLMMISTVLPVLTQYGLQGAVAILALGAALIVFGAGALVAGAGALVLGAGLTVVAVAATVLAAAFLVLASAMLLAAVSLVIVSTALPTLAAYGTEAATAIVALGAALVVFGAGAIVAGAAVIVLGAAFLAASVGILLCAAGIALLAVSIVAIGTFAAIAGASFALMAAVLPLVTANNVKNAAALAILSGGLAVLGAGALTAGAGFVVLGAGLLVAAAGLLAVGVAITALAAGILLLSVSAAVASGAIMLLSLALPFLTENAAQNLVALVQLGAGLLALGAGALVSAVGVGAFGAAMLVAAAGTLVMAAALLGVSSQMHTIAKDAKSAERSLKSMEGAMDAVNTGLDALGSKAKSAMKKLLNAFDDTTDEAKRAGKEVGTGFTKGMQSGLAQAPSVALTATAAVAAALNAGRARAFSAGAYISRGFAQGMLSCLGVIQSAASRMAAAADKAVRAKAKIHSPSRIAEKLGHYWGGGYANGLSDMFKTVWDSAERLVSIPTVATPNLAMAYSGELSADYDYRRNAEFHIEVPLAVDGKEFAKATVDYTEEELNKKQTRNNRKRGKI